MAEVCKENNTEPIRLYCAEDGADGYSVVCLKEGKEGPCCLGFPQDIDMVYTDQVKDKLIKICDNCDRFGVRSLGPTFLLRLKLIFPF